MNLSDNDRDKIIRWILRSNSLLKQNNDNESLELVEEFNSILDTIDFRLMDYYKNDSSHIPSLLDKLSCLDDL